ncbi:MAG: AsmA family outer membrane protein [Rhizobium sp.]|nr:AsmA family outer membrane protein [Rhizobium sp.]
MLGRIFFIVGGILVVALFAALFAPYFVDWTDFRRDFETQASRIIGKKVVVHGSVDARLLPFPTVTMTDVRVGEDESGNAIVTADKFSMETELAPFLSGEALIYNMHLEHPRVKLRLTEDGSLDWVKTGNPQIPASTVVLENVTISNGEVQFIDEQTGHDRNITGLNLKLSAKTLAGPWKVSGRGAVDGQAGGFVINTSVPDKGKLFMKLRLLPDDPGVVAELEGSLGLEGLRPQYAGTFRLREKYRTETANQESAETDAEKSAAPRIAGEFELLNDRLRINKYEFQMGDPVDPYIVTGEATIDAGREPDFLLTAVGQQIDMSRFGANSEGTSAAISLRDRLRAVMTLAADIPIPQMPGKATISLPALVAEDTLVRDIKLEMRPADNGWQIDMAEAQLPGRTTLSAKGKLTVIGDQSFVGDLLVASKQPSGFAEWVTGKVPESVRKLKSAGFSATVSIMPDLQRFENLEIAFGAAHLKGRLEHALQDGQAPTLSTELTGNQFDLDTVMALGGLLTGEASIKSVFDHKIAAKLKFGQFAAFGLQAKGVDTAFTLADGGIIGARATIKDFYGAEIGFEGSFTGLATRAIGEARIKLKSADPSALFQLVADRLPAHPAIRRLAASARYYEGSDFLLNLKLGEGDWPIEAEMTGIAHGSRFMAKLAAQSMDLVNSGGLALDATIENPDAWVMLGQAGLPTIPIDADQDGILTLHVNQPAESDPQVNLSYTSGTTTVTVEGQTALDSPHFLNGSYSLSVDSGDIAPYLVMNNVVLPRISEGLPFTATASVYSTAEAIGLENIAGNSDNNSFNGILSVDRRQATPLFSGEINLASADLLWLAEAIYGQVANPATPGLSSVAVPKESGLPAAADVALSVNHFHLGALGVVDNFRGRLNARAGRIEVRNATGAFATGRFKGNVELGNTDGNAFFRARLGITDAALKTVFWAHAGLPVASAKSNLSLVIDATGTSPHAMLETATGSGALELSDLVINGLNSKALPPILAGADAITTDISETIVQPVVEKSLFDGALNFTRLSIPFSITGAKLRADKVQGSNADIRIEAEGTLTLEDAMLEANVDAIFKPGEQAVAGADPTVRLNWQGMFNSPKRSVDVTQMTSFLSLRKFEQERRRVEILQAKMAEQQRLRRESTLYRARENERARLRQRALDNARLFRQAQEKRTELARQEEERRRKELESQSQIDNPENVPAQ